ncbi:GNAT family N-acetyltransferase [Lapidilactobacillus mulanensis]|uniref:GNAT family N-acetyltransferase n=1 Tax=Lapidilactobacillus mulanensis TaxID=2485999 RepID=A0ABW4DMM9_9LACO|nr:GNAT family N-acetyltransferase [Lapidilactobacillus mulanensis]
MNEINYRWSTLADYPALIAIENQIWNEQNTPIPTHYDHVSDYQKHFQPGSQLVAVIDGQPVGMISFNPTPPFAAFRFTWDIGIGVDPAYQDQGIGSGLLNVLKLEAQKKNIHKIKLNVLGTNPQARAFYLKNGFVEEGHSRDIFFLAGQFVDDYSLAYFVD